MTTSHPLFAVAPDWPQHLGKAAGEAFAEGLRVALKPLVEESKRQTEALEKLAKDEKKTAEALEAFLKALSHKDHRPKMRSVKQNAAAAAAPADRESAPVGTK